LKDSALRFFLPWACAGCRTALSGLDDEGFCGLCWLKLPRIQGIVCRRCGLPLKDGGSRCFGCRRHPPPLLIRAALQYRGCVPGALYRFKYFGRQTLAAPFSRVMAAAWRGYPELSGPRLLLPVPLSCAGQRRRGFNQAFLLARELGKIIALPVLQGLIRARATAPQYRLGKEQRRKNILGAFAVSPDEGAGVKGNSILLIDDVCTTASTLAECAFVLRRAGAARVQALVLARDS